jgi:hypothetical protein
MRLRLLLSVVVLLLAMTGEAYSEPKRVMLLHSFGRDFAPWNEYAKVVREELGRQSKEPIDIFEASLATARFAEDEEGPFVDYLHALFCQAEARSGHFYRGAGSKLLAETSANALSIGPCRVHGRGATASFC